MRSRQPRHTLTLSIWLGYLFFVIYGSLVPLDFRPFPLEEAWAIFQHIPMHKLGVESRADWISNGVLYVPVGFLTAHLLIQKFPEVRRAPLFILAGLFSITLAFSIEFSQIFFPPRSVSQNDLLAEVVGSLIGLILAGRFSDFTTALHTGFSNPRRLTLHLVEAYLVGYIAFSLFPYDILLSSTELEQKIRGDNWGWLLAGDPHGKILIVLKALSEIILTLPFGLYLGYRSGPQPATLKRAFLVGSLLGGFIEIAQFFTASGVSQGLSLATRIAGVCGGLALWTHRENWSLERLAALAQRYTVPLGVTYLLILLKVNGWFSHRWDGAEFAASRLGELQLLPFYYHYYTTEAKALVSLAFVCIMYLPIGLLTWINRGKPAHAFVYALLAASFVEAGKLFLQGMHPDPTNIMLGALASWGMVHFARLLSEVAITPCTTEMAALKIAQAPQRQTVSRHAAPPGKPAPIAGKPARCWASYAVLLPSLAFAGYWAATYPTQPVLLCLLLGACATIIWQRPVMLVAIIPAALPVLDLAPWSGRYYLDEFDLLVFISLAIGYTRIPPAPRHTLNTDTLFALASGLLAISFAISALRGLTPWQTPNANAFTNYYSPFNALRIGKGALWALLAVGLLRRMVAAGMNVQRPFMWGLVTGLTLTVAVVVWERIAFSGLFNFASDYRVTGPFSAMHTGGAYIECFLVIATPFVVILLLKTRSWIVRIAAVTLLLATTYSLMVTFSRNGYLAFGVALAIILFFALFKSGRWQQRSILVAAMTGTMLAVALPVFTGQFAQDRIATVSGDYAVRQAHWEDALDIRTPGLPTTLFGVGLGRYPETHYLLSSERSHSGTYQFKEEDGNVFLRLISGSSIYIEQLVSVVPKQKYLLKLDARANKPDAKITIPICEKWLLASYNCIWSSLNVGKEEGVWRHFEVQLSTDPLSISPWYSQRPIKLALYNGNTQALVDIDNVRLETITGENLLLNGDFSDQLDHWFFSADSHLQWHAKSLPVAVLFDQGWFGLVALGLFSILAIKRAAGRAWGGSLFAAAALASFSGFLVVGLFDTLIDAPRFLFLFIMLGGLCGFGSLKDLKVSQNG